MAARFARPIHKGDNGPDVLAVKRALKAAGYGNGVLPTRGFGAGLDRQLRRFQRNHGLTPDGIYGRRTHARLLEYFDAYGAELLAQAPKATLADRIYARLLADMEKVSKESAGYLWGGGHGVPLTSIQPWQKLDCSSSTSWVLWRNRMFPGSRAIVSSQFEQWGEPGPGKYFTVYANWEHVWVRLHKGKYWRFDTSPHGDGGRGPRLRRLPRFTRGFTARHWKGL